VRVTILLDKYTGCLKG